MSEQELIEYVKNGGECSIDCKWIQYNEKLTENGIRKPIYVYGVDDIGKGRDNTTTYDGVGQTTK